MIYLRIIRYLIANNFTGYWGKKKKKKTILIVGFEIMPLVPLSKHTQIVVRWVDHVFNAAIHLVSVI